MARKKKDNLDDWNRSLGYSDDAMKALKSGSYGQLTNRKAQSVRSEDQARIANPTPIPSLAGMKPINDEWESSFSKARQYQQNIENEAKKFQYDEAIANANTLDKQDRNYIQGLVDRLGNSKSVIRYIGDHKAAEWEKKYGKSIEQIYNDYIADQGNAKIRQGKEHPFLSAIQSTLGGFGKPMVAIPHLVSNLIDPDSEVAREIDKQRTEYSDQLKRLDAGVKERLGDTGDKVYDTAKPIAERMLLNTAGNVIGGTLGAGLLTGLADYSDQMDALNLRPDISGRRKAATALTHGAIEGAGNAITRGILDGLPVVSGVGGKVLNVGKGAGNAAAENAISEAIEMGLDTAINKENSERELNKAIYMSQGMSEAEAEEQVQNDQWNRVLGAAGTGALFGGFTKGLGEALDSAKKIPALKGLFGDTEPEAVDTSNVDTSEIDNVIDDATKQAETAKANIQNLADQIPEVGNTTKVELPENPTLTPKVRGLAGDDLKAAQDKVTSNKSRIKALENEIKLIENDPKNKYRGNLKKSAKADIESRKAQIAELKQDNKVTTRQIKGEPTPVIEQLDADSVTRINDFKKEIRKIGNMWVDGDGKQLANDVNAALDRYVESGSQEDFNEFARDLWQLHASANREYSSKSGNVSRYSDYYGDVEDGIFGAALRDNGLIPNKAIRDFHSGRIDDDNVIVTPAESAPNEPLPINQNNESQNTNTARIKEIEDSLARIDEKLKGYAPPEQNRLREIYTEEIKRFNDQLERLKDGALPTTDLKLSSALTDRVNELNAEISSINARIESLKNGYTIIGDDGIERAVDDPVELLHIKQDLLSQRRPLIKELESANKNLQVEQNKYLRTELEKSRRALEEMDVEDSTDAINDSVRRGYEQAREKLIKERTALLKGNGNGGNNVPPTQNGMPDNIPPRNTAPIGNGGEPPVPPRAPEISEDGKVRSFSKRGSQDETLPEDIRNTLSEDYYRVVHNADVEARADSLFVPEDLTQTRSNLDRAVEAHDPASALLSYKLAKAYVDNGDYDAATDVLENVSAELTRMGQFTQAAKLAMLQNDPMAAMRSYMRDLEKLNEWGSKKYKDKWNKLELSEEDIDAISKIQKGDKDALNAITDQLNEKFARQIPANWWDKAVGASKTAMLLNLRTQSRNILANMATLPIRSASDRVSAIGQNIVHLLNPDMKVTQSLTGGTKEQKAIAEQIFEQNKAGILGENKMKDSVKSDILSQRQIFNDDAFATWVDNLTNGGIQKLNQKFGANGNKSTMETLQNLTYWLMGDVGDTPFVKKNFVNRLASYMKAQGINKIEDVPDDAIAIATQEALKATFKDDNAFTKALQGIKQKTGKFGEVALPFVKTPANLTMRAIDYSPAGLYNTFKKIKSGADANAVIDELAKNITGTGMIYLGYKLAEKGLLSGSYSDDPDEAQFQRQQGMLENAIHIGDKYFTYDWTQPAATPLILGQTIYEAVKASDKQNAEIKDIVNATVKGGLNVADTVINSSPLQSLADIMGGDEYSDKSVAKNVANEIIEFPQRFVPSVLGATARTIDPVMRDTYIDDDSLTGTIGNNLRQMEAKIPFLSKRLPVSYDTWGNPRTRSDSVGEAFVAQMVNPGTMGNKNETPLDAEIQRLFDATGNNAVFPAKAGRSLDLGDDGNLTLTNRQHSEYQKALGKKSYSYVEAITNSDEYKNLSDDQKAAIIAKAYKLSNAMVKEEMFKHTTDDDKKLKEVARTGDANAVAKYLLDKNKADNLGISMDKYQKLESEAPGSAEQWMADKDNALNIGFTKKDGTVNMDSYEKAKEIVGDDPNALAAYSDYAKQGFTKNADRLYYLENNPSFTNEQKGQMLTSFKEDGSINGQTAQGTYDLGGFEGMYYYYLIKNNAESNGKSGINKKERAAYFASDAPELDQLWNYNQDLYYYLMNNIK